MNRAVFLDRDGTINYDNGYTYKLEDLRIYEDIMPLTKKYYQAGYLIIVISNQSGINRGYYSIQDMQSFNKKIEKTFEENGIKISQFYYCPHKPDENCSCRKPETGMVERAIKEYNINLNKSVIIGDRDDIDGKLAKKLNVKFIKVHGYDAHKK